MYIYFREQSLPKGFQMSEKNSEKDEINQLYEKRKKSRRHSNAALANVIITGGVFALVTVGLYAFERPSVSNIENRKLSEFPEFSVNTFFSGEYTDQISDWFNDTVPQRDMFKNLSANMKNMMGISSGDVKISGTLTAITQPAVTTAAPDTAPEKTNITPAEQTSAQGEQTAETTTAPAAATEEITTTTAPQYGEEIADGVYTNGQIVVYQDGHWRGLSMYGGGSGETYAKSLNAFKKDLGDDINVYSMVVPTAGAYYTPANFAQYNASHLDSINSINSMLDDDITAVDAYSVLGEHITEPIYTRTDHHWQPLGAYYAAKTFAEAAGVEFADISAYTPVTIDGYVGTLYSFTESAELLNDPEQFVYYKPSNDYTCYYYDTSYNFDYDFPLFVGQPVSQSYSIFMGGDAKIVRIETDCKNGRKLAILKDSYGNAEVPFYTSSFEEIYVLDIRYFDLNAINFIKEQGITDVLFTMCTFSAVGPNANNIDIIRTQQ